MKLIFAAGLFAATSAIAVAQSQPGASNQSSARQKTPAAGGQTLTGCLTAAENIYTLTVMDDSGAPGTTATTTAYTLLPGTGVDLKNFVDKRVTVKGAEAGPDMQSSTRVVQRTPAATGTSGTSSTSGASDQPTVQTESKARINAKTLNVTDVQPATGSCGAQ